MIRESEVYKIGTFNKPHGIHGELAFNFTDDAFDREEVTYFVCPMDGILVPFFIQSYRINSEATAVVKLEGVDTTEEARLFINVEVFLPVKYAKRKKQEEIGWNFFVGFSIEEIRHGKLGEIKEVDTSTINTLFVVDCNGKELLLPAQEKFITTIDRVHCVLTVELPEGLLELEKAEEA